MNRRIPWLVPESITFLRSFIQKDMRVLEFGSGGSTLWFSDLGCKVISVEHDGIWVRKVKAEKSTRITIIHHDIPYHSIAEKYPDTYFDIVMVDGRRRCDCMIASARKIALGGLMILDNSEREDYLPGMAFIRGFGFELVHSSISMEPYPYPGWTTSIWQRQ